MKENYIRSFNLINQKFDFQTPLTIGNGDFAMTFDAINSQNDSEYNDIPLSTMTDLFWFKAPLKPLKKTKIGEKSYLISDDGQEEAFLHNRKYPHKFNLFHLELWNQDGPISKDYISDIYQELDLYRGLLSSRYLYKNHQVESGAIIAQSSNQLCYKLDSSDLELHLVFYYPSPEKTGEDRNIVPKLYFNDDCLQIYYNDLNSFKIYIRANTPIIIKDNEVIFTYHKNLEIRVSLDGDFKQIDGMEGFWEEDSDIFSHNRMLDERMILSKYLLKVNSCGIYPPSESGITYNNWYSKFHLEMHLIHCLWLIYSNHIDLFLKSFDYYLQTLPLAKQRAKKNGYKGLRYPKMTSPDGNDSPSSIGPLLVWQAPHVVYALQEIYRLKGSIDILKPYKDIIFGVIDFMVSFLTKTKNGYEMLDPLLECSEHIPVDKCQNPMFEMEYFREVFSNQGLIDTEFCGYERYDYNDLIEKMVGPKSDNGVYLRTHGIQNKDDIYDDHPTEAFANSFFKSPLIDDNIMKSTMDFIEKKLDFSSFWGWDFPFLGMSYLRLGMYDRAIDIAFNQSQNNLYRYNGHNTTPREDLKVYLPANGAYVLFYQMYIRYIRRDEHGG